MIGLRVGTFATSFLKRPYVFSKLDISVIRSVNIPSIRTFSVTNTTNMKYIQFTYKNKPDEIRVGYVEGENVVDINKCNSEIPSTLLGILEKDCLDKVERLKESKPSTVSMSSINLMAPITGMDKVMCIGLNYSDHCREQNLELPKLPMIFSKFSSTVIGPSQPLKIRTEVAKKVDWEVELALVIGKKCTNVKAADAYKVIFGYTIAQDISSRDWQKELNGGQFLLGKAQDGFCPIGPWIVTRDEIEDPQKLDIRCSVNGEEKQSSNTSNLIHKIPDVIERLSSIMTLLPGDMLLTGTPGGVGAHRKPPQFLKPGDVVRNEIQDIGAFDVKVEKF